MHVQQHMTRQNGEGGVKKTRTNVTPNLSCHVLLVQANTRVTPTHYGSRNERAAARFSVRHADRSIVAPPRIRAFRAIRVVCS